MIKVTITGTRNVNNHINKIQRELEKVPQKALDYFKYQAPTPIRSGNARKNTSLRNKKDIIADYPYAKKLDEGYSKQARQGMTKPTMEYIKQLVRKIIRGK